MSQHLISRSPDLTRLWKDGYQVEINANHLVVKNVPYVNSNKEPTLGTLVSELTLAGDKTATPGTHVIHFDGDYPCNKDGSPIEQLRHQSTTSTLAPGLTVRHSFSCKPKQGYADYYEKMITYFDILAGPACSLDPSIDETRPLGTLSESEDSVFCYADTASTRAEITMASKKFEGRKIAIIGLGGTGSYILDQVAKTPVREVHLFDGDRLLQHSAFRAPGAPTEEELLEKPFKVDYYRKIYSNMHKGIHAHPHFLEETNVDCLDDFDFVFISVDNGQARSLIIKKLSDAEIPFIDVGMGLHLVGDSILGQLRVTTCTPEKHDHIASTVPLKDGPADAVYTTNIQVADLNAFNAVLAVVRWKKLCGFYLDLEHEHTSIYTLNGNDLINEDNDGSNTNTQA